MVVFANHNLLSDPPFTKLSLVSCRNLLIYLQPPMQQRLLTLFSFALRDEGVLFLGGSESIGDATDRFQPLATRANLYRNRRIAQPPPVLNAPARVIRTATSSSAAIQRATARITAGETPSLDDIHRQIATEFAPPCVVIDSRDEVIQIIGSAGDYLKLGAGGPTRNIFKLTAHNLANALRSALIRAQQKGDKFTYDNVRYKADRKTITVRLHIRPLPDRQGRVTGTRLIFIEPVPNAARENKLLVRRVDNQTVERITDLERDLSLTRETLQATVQDLETSNEEIQAANEELLAANEELQSTNEELQSVNEELHTVNVENQNRIEELTRLTNDINNLLATAAIGVLLIDSQLRVRRASRSALLLLDLTEADLGVPIETVARLLHTPDLSAMAQRVMQQGQTEEREIDRVGHARWLLIRCVPFRDELGRTQGVVLTLIDITERHLSDRRLLAQASVTQAVLDAMEATVAILDREGTIKHVNRTWRDSTQNDASSPLAGLEIGQNYFKALPQADRSGEVPIAPLMDGMQRVLRGELPLFMHDYETGSGDGKRWFRLHVVPMHSPEPGLAIAHFNFTPLKNAEAVLSGRSATAARNGAAT